MVDYLQQKCPLLVSQAVPRKLRKLEGKLKRIDRRKKFDFRSIGKGGRNMSGTRDENDKRY